MVRSIFLILLILAFGSCEKTRFDDLKGEAILSDYLDIKDSMKFEEYDRNLVSLQKYIIWTKTYDKLIASNMRAIGYKLTDNMGNLSWRDFVIEPNKLKASSDSANHFLSFYKSDLMSDSIQRYYIDKSGNYTRYFSSKLVDIETGYFKGKCLWTFLEFTEILNNLITKRTTIDEYYGFKAGLIKIRQEDKFYYNGQILSDSITYRIRVL